MSVYPKQRLPIQFLKFGVDSSGIIVPVLRRGKDTLVRLPPAAKPANPRDKNPAPSR